MRSPIFILAWFVLNAITNAAGEREFRITLAGWVKNPEHVQVHPATKLSEAIKMAGGIDAFGVKYRFYRVRIIDLNATERGASPDFPPNQKKIHSIAIPKDADPTMAELGIIAGDLLVFDRKHFIGK